MTRAPAPGRVGVLAGLLLALVLCLAPHGAVAKGSSEERLSANDEHANHDLDDLRRRIRDTQRDLAATEESRSEAADALRKSEQAISEATRNLRALNAEEAETQAALVELARAQSVSREAIQAGQQRLVALLRRQYHVGGDEGLALLLSGEDPGQLARDSVYLRALTEARQKAVNGLRHDLARLASLNREAQAKAGQLARNRDARARERTRLQQESASRAKMVAELSSRLQAQRRNLQTMQRDEKRLTQLVERISKALEERRLQREKQQKERAQQKERERAERERQQRDGRAGQDAAGTANGPGGDGSHHDDVIARIDESAEEGYDTAAFPHMKGRLRLPITGELANRYGSPREDGGLSWRGLFIRAPQGRDVHAVAAGRVVYSDWLRGFGNLLIIDHGAGYMSLYGNTEALLAKVGAVVKGGEVVASVGNSGGNMEPGLYFELRYQSRPFDPLTWVGKP